MTPSEFKAWFEGFTESMDGPPSLKQWERIQARVKQITGAPTTYPVYVDRYRPRPYWQDFGTAVAYGTNSPSLCVATSAAPHAAAQAPTDWRTVGIGTAASTFDSHAAMNALGKADAADLAAA